jgi:hypothetical protein
MRFSSADAKTTDHSFAREKLIEVNFFVLLDTKGCRRKSDLGKIRVGENPTLGNIQQQEGPIGSHACDDAAAFAGASGSFSSFTL